jgi:xylose isomerase
MFNHPRFMAGAGTNPDPAIFAYAASQVKRALDATNELGGQGYVFWGGREGYTTLLNTDLGLELDNLARLFHLAVDYKEKIGFDGQFYIEPKPKEPTKHQYDFDAGSCHAFLQKYDLADHLKLNVEANHATLAGHTFHHELAYCIANDLLGSVDANRGDLLLGWDTDQFPTDLYDTTYAMYLIVRGGGFTTGGLNFDAHIRRQSIDPEDLFIAHIGGMDAFARGLEAAAQMIEDGTFADFVAQRYAGWTQGLGKDIKDGKVGLEDLEAYTLEHGEPQPKSGKQELLENILNEYI